jgi:hypothetical protein
MPLGARSAAKGCSKKNAASERGVGFLDEVYAFA